MWHKILHGQLTYVSHVQTLMHYEGVLNLRLAARPSAVGLCAGLA